MQRNAVNGGLIVAIGQDTGAEREGLYHNRPSGAIVQIYPKYDPTSSNEILLPSEHEVRIGIKVRFIFL